MGSQTELTCDSTNFFLFNQVLTAWRNTKSPSIKDLRTILNQAETRGFVQKGTQDVVLNGAQPTGPTIGTGRKNITFRRSVTTLDHQVEYTEVYLGYFRYKIWYLFHENIMNDFPS